VAFSVSARRPTETNMQADSRDENFEFVSYHTRRVESIANRKNDFVLSGEFECHISNRHPW
jgi:hypothetical protein